MTREQIGSIIKELREEKDITQSQLADMAGVKQPAVSSVEKGEDKYGDNTVRKICKALGIDVLIISSNSYSYIHLVYK